MLKSEEVRRQVAHRLRELLPKARGWQESTAATPGGKAAGFVAKFQLAGQDHTVVVEVSSLGQPRQIRASVTRLNEIRRDMPGAYPVAASVYIGPQSARILKSHNLGFVDLSGNCYLAFENVLIEKEGKRNVRPSTRPLRSLFAPRATRVVRALLVEPARAWRLEELARAAVVSLGHSHNVIKRLEELAWAERDAGQRIHLSKPADLLEAWCESYTYRANEITSYLAPERVTRTFMGEIARVATAEGRRYAFTLNAGAALLAPSLRLPTVHCYLEGDPATPAQTLGLRPAAEADGTLHFLDPYDPGVLHGAYEKGGLKVVCLPQLYADLIHYERRGPEQAEHLRREAMGY
jgi:hypothetical protein